MTTVPKAGRRLLETEAKFFIWPLECLRNSSGSGTLVSDIDALEILAQAQAQPLYFN